MSEFNELKNTRILLIDDDPDITEIINNNLSSSGASCVFAKTICEAKKIALSNSFDLALVDIFMPDGNGVELIHHFTSSHPDVPVIAITGYADESLAISLEQAGVRSVITKPFNSSQLQFSICKELIRNRMSKKSGKALFHSSSLSNLIGNSTYMRSLRDRITILAQGTMPVLICGPTGTGKEVIAHAIHALSERNKNDMIIVNSSAIPEHLEESEFFGHARGAFTGAHSEKHGILTCADKSTLFLDEVGELSLRMQAKLLRALDGYGFSRVGEVTTRTSDFRLISATNRSLLSMIEDGSFRKDLYFRLKAASIETVPLAQHDDDIPALIEHFLRTSEIKKERRFMLTDEALSLLLQYKWPGNIRELRNTIESLCAINMKSGIILPESIPWVLDIKSSTSSNDAVSFGSAKEDFERSFYRDLLVKHNGNISMAAREAGIHRPNLSRKLKDLGLQASDFKGP